jgi:glycosyltransferase involved in cell wall biosynthesis
MALGAGVPCTRVQLTTRPFRQGLEAGLVASFESVSAPSAISVVIPAWGAYAGRWLESALASIREQGLVTEIVIVDNASTPPIAPVEGVHVLRLAQRVSLGHARNLGVQRATGRDVVVWDADDLMLPGTLAALTRARGARPGSVAAAARIVEDSAGTPHRWPRAWARRLVGCPRLFPVLHAVWSLYPTTGAVLISREALLAGGGFDDADSGDDWVAGVSLALRGRLVHVDHPGRLYRQHPDSIWDQHASAVHLVRHAGAVRARLRDDPATPGWLRNAGPVVTLLQWIAIYALRPLARAAASVRR